MLHWKKVVLAVAVAALALPLKTVMAAEDVCDFQARFEQLRAIQVDGSRDYIEAIRAQLKVRKEILRNVIDCALKEVRARQENFKKLPAEYQQSDTGKTIAKDLEDSAGFYAEKKKSIDNLGIKGTQDLARDIAFWRSHNYKPITEKQDNYWLWSSNQNLFQKTAARFAQIKPAVISVTLLDNEEVAAAWKEAEKKFEEASEKNAAAKVAFQMDPEKAPILIKASLEPLAEIYKKFMEVSEAIKKSVP